MTRFILVNAIDSTDPAVAHVPIYINISKIVLFSMHFGGETELTLANGDLIVATETIDEVMSLINTAQQKVTS